MQEKIIERLKNIDENMYFKKANLHIHSKHSDGKMDFDEIVKCAKENNMEHIAIVDHNTISGYKNTKYKDDEILIPSVEFDCIEGHALVHIIGYGVDIENEELKKYLMKTNFDIRGDIIRVLTSRNAKKVIKAILNANGVPVLAHPCCVYVFNLDKFTKKLINYGLMGIETYYPYKRHRGIIKFHSRKEVIKIAEKYNLIKTGGTDEHNNILDSIYDYTMVESDGAIKIN